MTKQKADQIAADLFLLYSAEVYKKNSLPLVLENHWEDPYFGASALKEPGGIRVFVRGGLVRVPEMTDALLALVVCHELGHALGGEPYQSAPGSEWSSVEGQADFFAASQCLPRYFQAQAKSSLSVDTLQKKILETALAAMRVLQKYSGLADKPVALEDTAPESATEISVQSYPSLQCRLDTFKAGVLCLQAKALCKAPACWWPK